MSPISSNNSVPPSAATNSPSRSARASVNDPRACPNNSLSNKVSDNAAQFTATNGRSDRGDASCTLRATNSFPVPLSPVINSDASDAASGGSCRRNDRIGSLRPISRGNSVGGAVSSSERICRVSRLWSAARRIAATKTAFSNGLVTKSYASARNASTAVSIDPNAVITTTGRSGRSCPMRRHSSIPSVPGMRTSVSTASKSASSIADKASSARLTVVTS